jgi:hypothetical protein
MTEIENALGPEITDMVAVICLLATVSTPTPEDRRSAP